MRVRLPSLGAEKIFDLSKRGVAEKLLRRRTKNYVVGNLFSKIENHIELALYDEGYLFVSEMNLSDHKDYLYGSSF